MSNNCLVTKLKESVQNENLPKLGVIRIPLMANQTSQNNKVLSATVDADVLPTLSLISGDFTLYDPQNNVISLPFEFITAGQYVKVTTGNTAPVIEISSKYAIRGLGNILNKASRDFSVKDLIWLPLEVLECSTVMEQKVEDVIKIQTLIELILAGNNCTGDFTELGKLVNLTRLDCYGVRNGLVGTIEGFVAKTRLAGRTTGSITFRPQHYATTITYQDAALDFQYTWTIAWTADSISVTH